MKEQRREKGNERLTATIFLNNTSPSGLSIIIYPYRSDLHTETDSLTHSNARTGFFGRIAHLKKSNFACRGLFKAKRR